MNLMNEPEDRQKRMVYGRKRTEKALEQSKYSKIRKESNQGRNIAE